MPAFPDQFLSVSSSPFILSFELPCRKKMVKNKISLMCLQQHNNMVVSLKLNLHSDFCQTLPSLLFLKWLVVWQKIIKKRGVANITHLDEIAICVYNNKNS